MSFKTTECPKCGEEGAFYRPTNKGGRWECSNWECPNSENEQIQEDYCQSEQESNN